MADPDAPARGEPTEHRTRGLAPGTLAVSAGRPDRDPGAPLSVPPILTSTYAAGGPVSYARVANPTWTALEEVLAALEGPNARALTFSSGMGAVSAVADLLPVGATVLGQRIAYNGTRSALTARAQSGRIVLREARPNAADLIDALPGADLVWLETPTNPTLDVVDLADVIPAAHAAGALVVVDSTFATPLGQRPLALGADVVVHSATKYLSGHSDVILGAVLTRDEGLLARLTTLRILGGAIPGPMEAWLALRGLRTFPLRWERACANAQTLAERCAAHPAVSRVRYLGLPDDPGHTLASQQMSSFGAIVAVELHGVAQTAETVAAGTRLWLHATSLGGVESTLERRRRWPEESADVPEGLLRLSVGIEDVEDLWADLAAMLDAVA